MTLHTVETFVACLVGGLLLYPAYISLLAHFHAGQRIGPFTGLAHQRKAGTPTMGGLLFCLMAIAGFLVFDRSRSGFLVAFALAGSAAVGVLDDLANIRGEGAFGLLARQKLLLQLVIGVLVGIGVFQVGLTRQVIPGLGAVDLHWGVVILVALAVVAASNAVNLTDGVDGLAASCSVVVLGATWFLALHVGNRPTAVLSAALVGALLAFLVYNWHPARVFMGDTGALALGAALAVAAAELRLLWLLPLLGVVFAGETLSVIVNVTAITRFHRRVLRASPIHHHFEALGLRERRLVAAFTAVAALGALLTVLVVLPAGRLA